MHSNKRALILSPAGRLYSHDKVQWYAQSDEQIVSNYFNIGDMIVYDSTLKMLDYSEFFGLNIKDPSEADIEFYREFDAVFVRASNFIHNGMDWLRAVEILERIGLPIYAIGVGGQASSRDQYTLTGDNLRLWQLVSERSQVIGVRGTFTAEMLYHNGIRNVEICGCPSILRTRNRALKVEPPAAIKDVAVSIRREVDGTYTDDVEKYIRLQREFVVNVSRNSNATITIHGEPQEKAFYYERKDLIPAAIEMFESSGWWTPENKAAMQSLYLNNLFFFLRVEDYDNFIRTQDCAIGYRVHGVLPGMANGVPGILVRYDARSIELADTHAIPSVTPEDAATKSVEQLFAEADFASFNKSYAKNYDKMKFVLEQNSISYRL
jgi:hypothetical protein